MLKTEIPTAALERNKAWIEAVTESLCRRGDEKLSRCTMKAAGNECAAQLLEKTATHFGRKPKSVAEMVEAINKRRKEVLNATTFWELKENRAFFILEKCGCDLVEAGLATPNPTFCLCSAGMFESIFTPFHNGTVRTEIKKAIGMGDNHCEFVVYFE